MPFSLEMPPPHWAMGTSVHGGDVRIESLQQGRCKCEVFLGPYVAGRVLFLGKTVTLVLMFRKKTCADKTCGTSSFITQQWGLLLAALSPLLLPVVRGICKCHRKSEGGYLNNKNCSG